MIILENRAGDFGCEWWAHYIEALIGLAFQERGPLTVGQADLWL
jgi:hypothetical protein